MNQTTTSTATEATLDEVSMTSRAFEVTILALIMVASVVGNGSLWIVVLRTTALRTVTNMFILGLSLADLFVATFNMPFTAYAIVNGNWDLDDTACQVTGFTNMLTLMASVLSLCNISINRYFMVVRPSKFKEIYTKKKAIMMMIAVLSTSTLLSSLPLMGWCAYAYIPIQSFCFADWKNSVSYSFFMISWGFGVPCIVMTVCNILIFRTVRQSTKKVKVVVKESNSGCSMKSQKSSRDFDSMESSSGIYTSEEIDRKVLNRKKNKKEGNAYLENSVSESCQNGPMNNNVNGKSEESTQETSPVVHDSVVVLDSVQSDSSDATAVELLTPFNRRLSYRQACEKNERVDKNKSDSAASADKNINTKPKPSVNFDVNLLHPKWRESSNYDVTNTADISTDTVTTDVSLSDSVVRPTSSASVSGEGSTPKRRKRSRSSTSYRRREEIRLARSLAIIVVIFVLCWMPYCISMIMLIYLPEDAVPRGFHVFTLLIGYANSMCNPIVYGVMNKRFKRGYKRLFCMFCEKG